MQIILIIEDNEAIGDNTVELLKILGFQCQLAADGQTGLARFEETPPDLIFCDILMPGLSGYEVLQTIRSSLHQSHVPFYFMSAKSESIDRERGMALGATGYLIKPFSEEDLLNSICRHLELPSQSLTKRLQSEQPVL